jgi:hypothetical protein
MNSGVRWPGTALAFWLLAGSPKRQSHTAKAVSSHRTPKTSLFSHPLAFLVPIPFR